ncbi:DUF5667 domain-containing protein [Desulfosporosinus orientis]|nr:DUF5667 domain-containing protein [Desulfosporosinus orientis]
MLNKRLAIILTLALCVMPLYAPLALAETAADQSTVAESLGTDSGAEMADVSASNPDDVVNTDTEAIDGTEGSTETGDTAGTDAGETSDSDSSDTGDEDIPPAVDENGDVVAPGTLPDSPFYWLTTLIEKLQVALTFDPEKKTELLEEQALERMAEASAMIAKGDTEEAEGALTAYSEKLTQAQAFLASLTDTDSEVTQKLETALSQTHAKNIQTLGGLLDKLPPQAAQKVALNVVRSMEKSIAKMEKKDQLKVAKELRKATKGIEDSELSEEDQAALENLDETLDQQEETSEETAETEVVAGDTAVKAMALTTNTLTDTASKVSLKSNVQKDETKNKGTTETKKAEVQGKLETKQQDHQGQLSDDAKKNDKITTTKEEPKAEQKQQEEIKPQPEIESTLPEIESTLLEKDSSVNSSVQDQEGDKTQEKTSTENKKSDKSSSKSEGKSGGKSGSKSGGKSGSK